MNMKNAFLHGEFNRDIYTEQPKGFESRIYPSYVCELKKILYDLKQASRVWYGKIAKFLIQSDYSVAPVESNLFVKVRDKKRIVVLVYVDDLIITGNMKRRYDRPKQICQSDSR
ncbi:Retrovirus-related Pol polyprotein from transposon RE1-like protein [Drosera capensis]